MEIKLSSSKKTYILGAYFLLVSALVLSVGCSTSKSTAQSAERKNIKVLLVGGGASHDFDRWYKKADVETLEKDGLATVTYTSNTDSIAVLLPMADVLYLSNNQPINDTKSRQAIIDFAKAGKGILLAHAALWYNWKDWPEYNLQYAGGGSRGHDRYSEFKVDIINSNHPITKGVEKSFLITDERYYYLPDSAGSGVEVLATNSVSGSEKVYPSIFVVKHPNTRIAGIALGHDAASHDLPQYQQLLRNAIQWLSKK